MNPSFNQWTRRNFLKGTVGFSLASMVPLGHASRHVTCPSSPEVIAYLTQRFAMLAAYHPDFIWVDDDARMAIKVRELPYPCFCNRDPMEFKKQGMDCQFDAGTIPPWQTLTIIGS